MGVDAWKAISGDIFVEWLVYTIAKPCIAVHPLLFL
jgi:hypothetical protein